MKNFAFRLVILLSILIPSILSAQVDKTINDVKRGTRQANEAKHVAQESIQTGKDIIDIFKTLKKAKDSRFIIIPGISYQDKNFAQLKKALAEVRKVKDIDVNYKDDTATIIFGYKNSLNDLWDQISSPLNELFDVIAIEEPAILLSYKFAKDLSGSGQRGGMQKTNQPDNSLEKKSTSANPAEETGKNRGAENVGKQADSENLSGSLHSDVKYLDIDYFSYFNGGSAIIRKGNAQAMIDRNGNIIVPFNKYRFAEELSAVSNSSQSIPWQGYPRTGLFKISEGCPVNSSGHEVGKDMNTFRDLAKFSSDGKYFWFGGKVVDISGKGYSITGGGISDVSEGIVLISEKSQKGASGKRYKTLTDKYITAEVYEDADIFIEGMARVGRKDEFSVMRYGFINPAGKLVIPLQFSNMPGRFSSGLSLVIPKNQNEFEYGYIDKSGNVVIRQSRSEVQKYGLFGDFQHGYAFSPGYVMDTQGNIRSHQEWLASLGVKVDAKSNIGIIKYNSGIRVFAEDDHKVRYRKLNKSTGEVIIGCVDIQTGKIIEGPFVETLITLQFDPVSKLAYAKMKTGKDEKGHTIFREGFINEDGQFVIVKGSGSKW